MSEKVVILQQIGDEAVQMLNDAGFDVAYNGDNAWTPAQREEQLADADGVVALLTDTVDAALLDAAPHLRVVANVAVGYDNVDVDAATARGVVVTNTPDVLTQTTADLAFGLLLAIARRIPAADAHMRAGKYRQFELYPPMMGVDVYGKTLGIVGMGRIGTAVARRGALGFKMSILYTANSAKPTTEQELGAQRVSFTELIRQSDFVSINVPLTDETRHLFTLREFRQMKPTAYLINTARGPVIKEADLVAALAHEHIAGAALDVFEEEPAMHPELARFHERLIVTPHIGSASIETRRRMATLAVENIIAALQGKCPPTPVNRAVWQPCNEE